jgi:hypothetical protein
MRPLDRDTLAALISELDLTDLLALEMAVKVAIRMQTQGALSSDRSGGRLDEDEGPALHDEARLLLENPAHELTLADQALLAALVLSDAYQQDSFSSRAVNDLIEESGRPRIAHITSAIAGLTGRSFLLANDKMLSLSKEGRAKARGLIGMLKRRASSAAAA